MFSDLLKFMMCTAPAKPTDVTLETLMSVDFNRALPVPASATLLFEQKEIFSPYYELTRYYTLTVKKLVFKIEYVAMRRWDVDGSHSLWFMQFHTPDEVKAVQVRTEQEARAQLAVWRTLMDRHGVWATE